MKINVVKTSNLLCRVYCVGLESEEGHIKLFKTYSTENLIIKLKHLMCLHAKLSFENFGLNELYSIVNKLKDKQEEELSYEN